MDKQTDRRVLKTKKALKSALLGLLREKDLNSISIRDLSDAADVHRGTFYSHYQDIFALYEEIENDILNELFKHAVFDPSYDYSAFFVSVFDFVEENAETFRILNRNSSFSNFRNNFCILANEKVMEIAVADEDVSAETAPEHWKYLINYSSAGFFATLEMWIESNFSFPKDKLLPLVISIDSAIDDLF